MKYIENSVVELKRQVVEDIRKTVIAFANTKGGILYIGIDNDGTIVGVEDTDVETDGDSYESMRSMNQELTFESVSKEFSIRKVPFGKKQLKTLQIVKEDGIYTNLGLLLSDQCVHTIKAAVFEGIDKSLFKDRREFEGSLLKQLNDVFQYISQFNRIRSEFSGLYRIDRMDYPEEALRESILNVLVHRDYSFSSSALISIFDDRIEFVSIGGLVKGISISDIMLGISATRNERLANIFYRLALIEAYGTGIPKILNSYKGFAVQPKFEATDHAFKITLPNQNALKETIVTISEEEQQIIEMAQKQGKLKRKDVEEELKISQTLSGRLLRNLVHEGTLQVMGKGKNTYYVIK